MDEFELIELIRSRIGAGRPSPEGIGDDGAVLRPDDGRCVVLDSMVEGVHFRLDWSSWADVAHKLLARNLSDIQAMGAEPTTFLLGLVLNDASAVPAFAEGMASAVASLCPGVVCVGGDTTRTPGPAMLTMTMLGRHDGPVLGRACARAGDRVWVQGPLGWAAAGLHALSHGYADAPDAARFVAAHRRPMPRPVRWPDASATPDFSPACIDVSDGLYADLLHIAHASGVAIEIDAPLPGRQELDAFAATAAGDPDAWQWFGGDDYVKIVCSRQRPLGEWFPIGSVFNESPGLTGLIPATSGGYRHFS